MKKIAKIFIFAAFGFFISANFALALEGQRDLSIRLSNFLGFTVISGLSEYIGRIYNIMIGLAGGVASFMIIVAGFQYVLARGDASKIGQAKKRITNSIVALFLIFGAYFILNTINPAILSLHLPEIKTISRVPLKFQQTTRVSYCPVGQSNLTSNDATRARQLCADQCGGEEQISSINLSTDPSATKAGSGSIGLDTWCCLCISGCREGQWAIPAETPDAELGPQCRAHCEPTYEHFEVFRGPVNCCACSAERTEEFTESGSQVACLREDNPATPDECAAHSGTNGQCTRVNNPLGDNSCEWEAITCDEDSDCPGMEGATGAGHCWGEQCFQTWLSNGDICEDLGSDANGACQSGYCEVERGGHDYCTERCDNTLSDCICDGCIGALKYCQETEECSGSGKECLESGQITICNFP